MFKFYWLFITVSSVWSWKLATKTNWKHLKLLQNQILLFSKKLFYTFCFCTKTVTEFIRLFFFFWPLFSLSYNDLLSKIILPPLQWWQYVSTKLHFNNDQEWWMVVSRLVSYQQCWTISRSGLWSLSHSGIPLLLVRKDCCCDLRKHK